MYLPHKINMFGQLCKIDNLQNNKIEIIMYKVKYHFCFKISNRNIKDNAYLSLPIVWSLQWIQFTIIHFSPYNSEDHVIDNIAII